MTTIAITTALLDRLYGRTEPAVPAPEQGLCALWTGAINSRGYGVIRTDLGLRLVHRVTYTGLWGPIPEGGRVRHLCKVKACVNPLHLDIGYVCRSAA